MNKLNICKTTREIAAKSLYSTLKNILSKNKPISELYLRDAWLSEMKKYKEIFPDGWYIPPPHGIGVLFGTEEDLSRINFTSLRPKEFWPRNDIFLNLNNGIALLYAGPVHRESGIIGDFEMTLYFGKNKNIINQLKTNLDIINKIFENAKIGTRLSEIASKADKLLKRNDLINTIYSISDPTNSNIGHTIPFSYEDMKDKEKKILLYAKDNWKRFYTMLSKKRKFINKIEQLEIKPGMAITIEPRSKIKNNPSSPLISFHAIALFYKNGDKELLTEFEKIFKLVGMDYML
ncbi:MAG: M24 family metallopeptidase [bacterium]|nr:M24 family metallopeptidase [bacterium]